MHRCLARPFASPLAAAALAALGGLVLAAGGCSPAQGRASGAPVLAITGATLLDGRGGPPIPDAVVVVEGGRIAAVGERGRVAVPRGARTLDARGMWVLPGFVDMHYHVTTSAMRYRRDARGALDSTYDRALAERLLRAALAHGITTVRDPGASPMSAAVALRDDVAAGRVLGPRVFTGGEILARGRMRPDEVRAAVAAQAAAGVDFVKVYAGIGPELVRAAVEEAHRRGLKVIGHLQRTSWTEAARAGIDFVTHAGNWHPAYLPPERRAEYAAIPGMRQRIAWYEWLDLDGAAVDTMLRELAERRIFVDPTLVAYHTKFWWRDSIYQRHPRHAIVPELVENWRVLGMPTADWSAADFDRVQAAWPKQLALVRRMRERGVPLTAGSDLASPWVIPGVGFHQELALLRSAGIPEPAVLRIATRNGAEALGIAADAGTVESGKRADLVLLGADPLADIRNTALVRHVVLGGRVLDAGALLGR